MVISGFYDTLSQLRANGIQEAGTIYGVGQASNTRYYMWDATNEDWRDIGVILEGPQGEQGNDGEVGPPGPKGDDGATFIPSVDDAGNISWTNDQGRVNPPVKNIKGPQGNTGSYFTPVVNDEGQLHWELNGGTPSAVPVNIRGPQGLTGAQGSTGASGISPILNEIDLEGGKQIQVIDAAHPIDDPLLINLWNGAAGADGVSPTVTTQPIEGGSRITIQDSETTSTFDVHDGTNGVSPTVQVVTTATGWTIAITDINGTQSFNVPRGNMNTEDYDPTGAVYNAGGIAKYVDIYGNKVETVDDIAPTAGSKNIKLIYSDVHATPDVLQLATIPTSSTVGDVGQFAVVPNIRALYLCINKSGSNYTWISVGGGGEVACVVYDQKQYLTASQKQQARENISDRKANSVIGIYSQAFGQDSVATGASSMAIGHETIASRDGQVVVGKYNKQDNENFRFIVGSGSQYDRSNAFAVDDQGNIYAKGNIYESSSVDQKDGSRLIGQATLDAGLALKADKSSYAVMEVTYLDDTVENYHVVIVPQEGD